ncbi:hypothetical protein [Microcoleus sp. D2_18a_B4]
MKITAKGRSTVEASYKLGDRDRVSCRAFKLYIQGGRDAHPTRL